MANMHEASLLERRSPRAMLRFQCQGVPERHVCEQAAARYGLNANRCEKQHRINTGLVVAFSGGFGYHPEKRSGKGVPMLVCARVGRRCSIMYVLPNG